MTHTIGVITNPTAGSGRGARWGHEALAALSRPGIKVRDLTRGSWGGAFASAMRERKKLDALVVVGGDGMAHLGIQICAEQKKLPLGIIAAGSGNDAAMAYGLPNLDIAEGADRIVRALKEDDVTAVDLGKLTGPGIEEPGDPRYFACVLSAGIDAAVAAYASNIRWPRGPVKYKVATMREVPRFKPYGIQVTADGFSWEADCTLVAVACTPNFGGGLIISRDSKVDDGQLEVVVAEGVGKAGILRLFPKLYDGSVIEDPRVSVTKAKKVTITQAEHGAALPAAFADGELVGSQPLEVSVAPKALRVLGARLP